MRRKARRGRGEGPLFATWRSGESGEANERAVANTGTAAPLNENRLTLSSSVCVKCDGCMDRRAMQMGARVCISQKTGPSACFSCWWMVCYAPKRKRHNLEPATGGEESELVWGVVSRLVTFARHPSSVVLEAIESDGEKMIIVRQVRYSSVGPLGGVMAWSTQSLMAEERE